MKIALWVPGFYDRKGGIQVFSNFLFKALQEQAEVKVVSKHDLPSSIDPSTTKCAGQIPNFFRTTYFSLLIIIQAFFSKPDLIISTHINFSPVALLIKYLTGTPYWLVGHGVEVWDIKNPLVRFAVKKADMILAVSQVTKTKMLNRMYASQEKVRIFYNTADSRRFNIRERDSNLRALHAIPDDAKILLTVARLDSSEQYKGYDSVIKLLKREENSKLFYLIVGDGNDRSRVERLVRELDLSQRVKLVGPVSDEALPSYYNTADLFVMPSTGEGFGIVFLEAMYSGLLCIGGNSDGARDALLNGELGELVNVADSDALSLAINRSLNKKINPAELRTKALSVFGEEEFKRAVKTLISDFSRGALNAS